MENLEVPTQARLAELASEVVKGDLSKSAELYLATKDTLLRVFDRRCRQETVLAGRIEGADILHSVFRWLGTPGKKEIRTIENAERVLIAVGRKRIRHYVKMFTTDRRNRTKEVVGGAVEDELRAGTPSPSSAASARERVSRLEIAVGKLPEKDRVWIRRWAANEGKTFKELALEFDTTEAALKKRNERLLNKLLLLYAEVRTHA